MLFGWRYTVRPRTHEMSQQPTIINGVISAPSLFEA
jgi:hypothetical protein